MRGSKDISVPNTAVDDEAILGQNIRRNRRKSVYKSVATSWPVWIGVCVLLLVIVAAVWPVVFTSVDPSEQNIMQALLPPSWIEGGSASHLLGTDALGRDIFARIVHGARISLFVSLAAVVLQGGLGLTFGLIAGFFSGWADNIIMRLADIQLAIPLLALVITVVAIVGTSLSALILVLGLTGWVVYARVVRAEVLVVKELEYVQAAESVGNSKQRIIIKHILPNVLGSFLVIATLQVALMILTESALSFLGLGIQPPGISWGAMIAQGRDYLVSHWWIATFPGVAILGVVLAINLVGDFLRNKLNPRL